MSLIADEQQTSPYTTIFRLLQPFPTSILKRPTRRSKAAFDAPRGACSRSSLAQTLTLCCRSPDAAVTSSDQRQSLAADGPPPTPPPPRPPPPPGDDLRKYDNMNYGHTLLSDSKRTNNTNELIEGCSIYIGTAAMLYWTSEGKKNIINNEFSCKRFYFYFLAMLICERRRSSCSIHPTLRGLQQKFRKKFLSS